MGGQAFSSGDNPLYTPRMPPNVYQYMLKQCHAKLQELFILVATPIPGPAKPDFGDIDIFLAWERTSIFPSHANGISKRASPSKHDALTSSANLLRAERHFQEQSALMITAIPWPDDLPRETIRDNEDINYNAKPRYIQVDLHLCDSLEHLQWMLFKHAHGDLWNIIGSTIRPYGLTVDDVGLHVRIPEIENLDRKKARVLLSTDPTDILSFLGLRSDGTQWEEPFASDEDLFEYATTCRLFWVRPDPEDKQAPTESGEVDKNKLKANDRRRMNSRPVFRKWINEFLPACRVAGLFAVQNATRDSVRAEAFEYFPGTQHTYETQLREWNLERQRQTLWRNVIKASTPKLPDGKEETPADKCWHGQVANAFKKIIMQDNYSLGIQPSEPLQDVTGFFNEEKVKQFVVDNWEQVSEAVRKANKKQYTDHLTKNEAQTSGL
ncbi:uncharacterized protein F4807DRAFT_406989 [Annulohypoxylon truncatum]|uniref:uncharacterized protein n=1 Tax=Annulohypoxylon truncatum TaxID=327061 RepID=UPI0020087398|nr:uncharacterized protein F4807DRAFT_406989 [Annulohypoxylon truncatum]KAI1214168.1 hypothetical protein F4807DRAFT_406989 [Annulohypoxylon truncatum]